MKQLYIVANILGLLLVQFTTFAQPRGRNALERASNNRQIQQGKKELNRDIKELEDFKALSLAFRTAHTNGNGERVRALKSAILTAMEREIKQTEVKVGQAKAEVRHSRSEVRSDNREIRHDRRDFRKGGDPKRDDVKDLARDKHNRRDDIRDTRDDVQDLGALERRLNNQRHLYQTLKKFTLRMDAPNDEKAAANRKLITDFIDTMENDIQATKRELGEDQGELREDRRETRDDRRERRERR